MEAPMRPDWISLTWALVDRADGGAINGVSGLKSLGFVT